MEKTIKVRGQANIRVKPDYMIIRMQCESLDKDYEKAMDKAARAVQELKSALESVRISSEQLKTSDFRVAPAYESQGYGEPKRFLGYRVRQDLKVGLDFDKKRLGEVLVAMAKSKAAPEFNIDFTVKDVNAVKDELFAQCAANARAIANGLCAGAGCKLGEILSINYSWDEIDISMGSCTCAAEADGCSAPDIDPEDIDVSDSVTFVWSIC